MHVYKQPLPERMKGYETDAALDPGLPVVCRIDGHRFYKWTAGFQKPGCPRQQILACSGIKLPRVHIQMMNAMDNEREYLRVLERVLLDGEARDDRTGTGTHSLFGEQMRFDISQFMPVITTKFVPWKSCIKELLWFCRGDTNAKNLSAQGVKIWDANTSRKFLDARGLYWLDDGMIGAGYGWQWRRAGAEYGTAEPGVDQLGEMLRLIKEDPYSRRIFMSSWAPAQLDQMTLPPCHVSAQFYVSTGGTAGTAGTLSCHMYQRSCDMFLGVPWNILSYSVLTAVLAKKAGLTPKDLIVSCGDVHIYDTHRDQVREQLARKPMPPPVLQLSDAVVDKTWEQLSVDDFEMKGYVSHPAIKAPMAI